MGSGEAETIDHFLRSKQTWRLPQGTCSNASLRLLVLKISNKKSPGLDLASLATCWQDMTYEKFSSLRDLLPALM